MLRVIAGKYRSRKLEQPTSKNIRPTKDRTKEAMFSTLMNKIESSIILDLFSGSGSLSIEASSRGAMKIIAVDKDKESISTIKKNIEALQINNIVPVKADVISYLKTSRGMKFDLIFIDPPYKEIDLYNESLSLIAKNNLIKDNGLIVVETSNPDEIQIPHGLAIYKNKNYGKSALLYISRNI